MGFMASNVLARGSAAQCWDIGALLELSAALGGGGGYHHAHRERAIISPAEEEVLGDKQHKIFPSQSIKLVFVKLY